MWQDLPANAVAAKDPSSSGAASRHVKDPGIGLRRLHGMSS